MNGSQDTDDLKERLHELPRVKASGDFETRLRRRLAASAHPAGALDRIPAFVYSSAAVALSCVLIVFLMTMKETPPQEQAKQGSPSQTPAVEEAPAVPSQIQPPAARQQMETAEPRPSESRRLGVAPRQAATPEKQVTAAPAPSAVTAEAPVTDASRATELEIDQQKTTTGTLELKLPDSLKSTGQKSRMQAPKVRDVYGVGTLGKSISSPLTDSLKVDSLKRLRKQLLKPKAIERNPNQ